MTGDAPSPPPPPSATNSSCEMMSGQTGTQNQEVVSSRPPEEYGDKINVPSSNPLCRPVRMCDQMSRMPSVRLISFQFWTGTR